MKQTRASAIEFETSAIGLEMQKQEIQKLKHRASPDTEPRRPRTRAHRPYGAGQPDDARRTKGGRLKSKCVALSLTGAPLPSAQMELEEKADKKEREKDAEMQKLKVRNVAATWPFEAQSVWR
eukprot:7124012-Prymnesium_polylepis.2